MGDGAECERWEISHGGGFLELEFHVKAYSKRDRPACGIGMKSAQTGLGFFRTM
jgi:hypothetical protein